MAIARWRLANLGYRQQFYIRFVVAAGDFGLRDFDLLHQLALVGVHRIKPEIRGGSEIRRKWNQQITPNKGGFVVTKCCYGPLLLRETQ
jgi:hypothetical protein